MKQTDTEKVKLSGIIGRETDKAIQFKVVGFGEEKDCSDFVWFPLSHVHEIHRTKSAINGFLDGIVISNWIAKKKGII